MRKERFTTSDFRLTFEKQRWAEETYEGFPVLRWPSGSICEPATLYFGWCLQYRRGVSISSLAPEAYAIREWLTFLTNQGIRYDRIDDLILRGFREAHSAGLKEEKIHGHQIERKLTTIYLFYRSLDELLVIDSVGKPRQRLVAPDETDRNYPVTTGTYKTKTGITKYVWSGSKILSPKRTKRPTPGIESVEEIFAWIRSKPERIKAAGIEPSSENYLLADRDWLIARTMALAGLRRRETAELSMKRIWQLLRDESIEVPGSVLEFANCPPEEQARILKDLENLNMRSSHTEIAISGKGGTTRYASLPVLFIIDLLKIWIWNWRMSLLPKASGTTSDAVFLSATDAQPLTPGAIGNIILHGFKDTKTPGSGHRLRAHYCTVTAIRLWEDEMQRNGFNFSQAVYNVILDRLADAMGHAKASTTVKYYLDLAVAKHFGFSNRAKYVVFSTIWQTVADNYTALSASDIRGIVKIITAFSNPGTDRLKEVIALALANSQLYPDVSPSPSLKQPQPFPRLSLAFDRDKAMPPSDFSG